MSTLNIFVDLYVIFYIFFSLYLVVHKGFITPQKVADLINELDSEMKRNTENKENNNKAIAKFLKGLKVIYEVPQQSDSRSRLKPRTYHLNGLGPNANEHKFPYKGSDITIRKYFENRYKYILRDPNLPCLSVGAQGNEIYLPAEVRKPLLYLLQMI